ncbi:MAG TPA: hypothetical protein VGL22_20320 [Terracidiphilus sp.]
MRTDRWLIAALVCLVGGLWLIFAWGHGNAGFNVAIPMAATKLAIDYTSTGWPVIVGVPLILIGILLMVGAFITAVIAQFHRADELQSDSMTRLRIPNE